MPSLANLDATISRKSFVPFDSEWIWLDDTPYDFLAQNPSLFSPLLRTGKCSFDVFTKSTRSVGLWWIFHARGVWVSTRIISREALATDRAVLLGLLLLVET